MDKSRLVPLLLQGKAEMSCLLPVGDQDETDVRRVNEVMSADDVDR